MITLRRWLTVAGAVFLLFLAFFWLWGGENGGLTEPEQVAVNFYQVLWQQRDEKKAITFLHPDARIIGKGVIEAKIDLSKGQPAPKVVELTEGYTKKQGVSCYYLYNPETKKTAEITVEKDNDGKWWVIKFLDESGRTEGLKKWKEVPLG